MGKFPDNIQDFKKIFFISLEYFTMKVVLVTILFAFISINYGYRPLRPQIKRSYPKANEEQVGEPLYLTPYIESGDIETGRSLAQVDWTLLEGIEIILKATNYNSIL